MDIFTVGSDYKVVATYLNVMTAATVKSTLVTILKEGVSMRCKSVLTDDYGNTWLRIDKPVEGWVVAIYDGVQYVG